MTLIDKIEDAVISIRNKRNEPYFRYGDLLEVETETEILNRVLESQHKKYPFVYMNSDYDETEIIRGKQYEADLIIWIIDRADGKLTAKERHTKEMPALRTVRDSLLRAIEINVGNFEQNTRKELFFNQNESEFETSVNAIRLQLTGLQYQLIECLI
jgi:hypothetical protein